MRKLVLAAAIAALPAIAMAQTAQQEPQAFTVSAAVLNHMVSFLHQGGTYSEAAALADQIVGEVRSQMKPAPVAVAPAVKPTVKPKD